MNTQNFSPEESESLHFLREMIKNRPGGENRPQQEVALLAIDRALSCGEHLLVQAGTGTGKSFATLIPAILSGKRVVYSTATKQLSEQLVDKDLPVLKREIARQGGDSFGFTLLKGRDNYACLRKYREINGDSAARPKGEDPTQSLFAAVGEDIPEDDGTFNPSADEHESPTERKRGDRISTGELKKQYEDIHAWMEKTRTGDRSEAPPVADEVWRGVSVNNKECVGRKVCPFGEECFSELVRAKAKVAQVVITNHAVTALSLESEDSSMVGERDVFIFDEVHELDNFVSSAWGTEISEKMILDTLKDLKKFQPGSSIETAWAQLMEETGNLAGELGNKLLAIEEGLIWPNPLPNRTEEILRTITKNLEHLLQYSQRSIDEKEKETMKRSITSMTDALSTFLFEDEENVRWCKNESNKKKDDFFAKNKKSKFKGKKKEPLPPTLHCAPIRIGPRLMESLNSKNAVMIGTSATITVVGKFDVPIHNFGLDEQVGENAKPYQALDAGTPFDYSKQVMLHVPDENGFPAADWKTIADHSEAVEDFAAELTQALGGRTLILTTKTSRIEEIANAIEPKLNMKNIKVLCQGDMPAPQLIEAFIEDETSVLVATMGMWHGLNAEGATCMGVIIDKIPFPGVDDPLLTARQDYAKMHKRNGFLEVYVATANVKLAQGFGRLIRTASDKGIVAILDNRLLTKRYGSEMLKSLPANVKNFKSRETIIASANRLREAREKVLLENN